MFCSKALQRYGVTGHGVTNMSHIYGEVGAQTTQLPSRSDTFLYTPASFICIETFSGKCAYFSRYFVFARFIYSYGEYGPISLIVESISMAS